MGLMSRMVAVASQVAPRLSSRVLASSGYTLDLASFGSDAFGVWRARTAERQDRAWQPIVERTKAGHPREDVAALYSALDPVVGAGTTLLEVGCGGGYNSEIIAHRYSGITYAGLDLSPAMIDIARAHYPDRHFEVGSAYEVPEDDNSWDVVMDGVALLHMPDWRRAVGEYARVARTHVVLHGLTLSEVPTVTFAKYAYGQPSLELAMNRAEVLAACEGHGLSLESVHPGLEYDLAEYLGIATVSETWVLTT